MNQIDLLLVRGQSIIHSARVAAGVSGGKLLTGLCCVAVMTLGGMDVVGHEQVHLDCKRMNLVPGGTIVTEAGRELSASSFLISASEVTWEAWRRVRAAADDRGYDISDRGAGFEAAAPVHSVTWYDVVKWCNLRSELEGRTPVYWVGDQVYREGIEADVAVKHSADGYRLVTDAEWEYAVQRAEQNLLAPDRDDPVSRPCLSGRASMLAAQSTGSDMSADLWEWCFDLLPGCEAEGRVVRGGQQSNLEILCRMGLRGSYPPNESSERIGFRVVLPVSDD